MNNVYIPKTGREKMDRSTVQSVEKIFNLVQEYFGLTREQLTQKSKKHIIVYPRQVCQWLLWHYSAHNGKGIGIMFNQVDSTSCENALKAISNYLVTDPNVKGQIEELETKLKNEN